jgi:hypothetical protein
MMPAQSTIEVCPPQLLSSADTAANHLEQAASPHPGVTPTGGGGSSLSDAAAAAIAVKVGTSTAAMSSALAPVGPAAETTTQDGVSQLEQTDEANAEQLRALGQQATARWR